MAFHKYGRRLDLARRSGMDDSCGTSGVTSARWKRVARLSPRRSVADRS